MSSLDFLLLRNLIADEEADLKLDVELAKEILSVLESVNGFGETGALRVDGYSQEQVEYHLWLLWKEGLIEALDASCKAEKKIIPQGLTWEGHQLLSAATNDTVWKKVKKWISAVGGDVAFSIVKKFMMELVDTIT